MDLINKIRRENGCDEAMLLRAENDPEILSTIQALQGNASRGLDRKVFHGRGTTLPDSDWLPSGFRMSFIRGIHISYWSSSRMRMITTTPLV